MPTSVSETLSDESSTDETGSAPIDTTAFVPSVAADPPIAVPAWLWVLSDPGAPSAPDVTTAACTGAADAAQTDDEHAGTQRFAVAGRQTFSDASTPVGTGRLDRRVDAASASSPQPAAGHDAADVAAAGDAGGVNDSIDADVANALAPAHSASRSVGSAYTRRGSLSFDALSRDANRGASPMPAPVVDADADATSSPAAAPDRFASARPVDRIALDRANRSATLFNTPFTTTTPAATLANGSTGQPAPLAGGASYTPGQAVDVDATPAEAAAPNRFGSARPVDRIALDRANRSGTLFSTTMPAATVANESTGQPAPLADGSSPVPARIADADATPAQAAAPDRFGLARPVDRIALDRANRSGTPFGTPFSATTPTATLAIGPTGGPAPLAGGGTLMPAQVADAGAPSAQAAAPDRFGSAGLVDRIALDRANRSGTLFDTPFSATTPVATLANGSTGQPAPLAARDLANVAAMDPATAVESHQSPSGQISSDHASRDEAQRLADRAIGAAFHVEHGASAARLVETVGVGALLTAAPASTPIPASVDAPIAIPDERDLRHQIVQGIKFQWRDGVGDVKLTLHPEYLGEMRIALRVDQGGVTAQLSADSASVRAWAVANESLLRQGLAEQGLTLSRLVVTDEAPEPSPDRESRRRASQQETPEPPAPRRSDAATFEIVV
jgi:hypothetical protein